MQSADVSIAHTEHCKTHDTVAVPDSMQLMCVYTRALSQRSVEGDKLNANTVRGCDCALAARDGGYDICNKQSRYS